MAKEKHYARKFVRENLVSQQVADTVMHQVGFMLHEAITAKKNHWLMDHWSNSSGIAGIREQRVRVFIPAVSAPSDLQPLIDQATQIMAQAFPAGTFKVYKFDTTWCFKVYYSSWQPGQPRKIQRPDPGYELTLHKGQRVKINKPPKHGWFPEEFVGQTGTIVKRWPNTSSRPGYMVKFDQPVTRKANPDWPFEQHHFYQWQVTPI